MELFYSYRGGVRAIETLVDVQGLGDWSQPQHHDGGAPGCARLAAWGRARRLGCFSVPRALKIMEERRSTSS
jgi:hypothetical protein